MKSIHDKPATLAEHSNRTIRAFLRDPKISGTELENRFFDHVYNAAAAREFDPATCDKLAAELERSPRRVSEILDGTYKPEALK